MKRKNKFFGHTISHSPFQVQLLEGKINGKRGRGRPRRQWKDNIITWNRAAYDTCKTAAMNRTTWRKMTSNLRHEDGTK